MEEPHTKTVCSYIERQGAEISHTDTSGTLYRSIIIKFLSCGDDQLCPERASLDMPRSVCNQRGPTSSRHRLHVQLVESHSCRVICFLSLSHTGQLLPTADSTVVTVFSDLTYSTMFYDLTYNAVFSELTNRGSEKESFLC